MTPSLCPSATVLRHLSLNLVLALQTLMITVKDREDREDMDVVLLSMLSAAADNTAAESPCSAVSTVNAAIAATSADTNGEPETCAATSSISSA